MVHTEQLRKVPRSRTTSRGGKKNIASDSKKRLLPHPAFLMAVLAQKAFYRHRQGNHLLTRNVLSFPLNHPHVSVVLLTIRNLMKKTLAYETGMFIIFCYVYWYAPANKSFPALGPHIFHKDRE